VKADDAGKDGGQGKDAVAGDDGAWTYLHKLQRGVNRSSHALKVARLAGLPESAIGVAEKMLGDMKSEQQKQNKKDDGK
jgi:DNA mismatch repair ATPase MutS